MTSVSAAEIQYLGGDASNPIWHWLIHNGPHGSDFTWGQSRSPPPGYVGVVHLESIVEQKIGLDSGFRAKARLVVRQALTSNALELLCRAIQIAAVVGEEVQLHRISELMGDEDPLINSHAKAAHFYLKRRLKKIGANH